MGTAGVNSKQRNRWVWAALLLGLLGALLWWQPFFGTAKVSQNDKAGVAAPRPATTSASSGAAATGQSVDEAAPLRMLAANAQDAEDAPNGRFAGRVINWGNGEPVAGAEVTFASDLGVESVATNGSGTFIFEPSGVVRYRLAAVTKDGFLPFSPSMGGSPIVVMPRARQVVSDMTLYLSPAIEYRGRVVDTSGTPVAKASIKIMLGAASENSIAAMNDEFTSDAQGKFVFSAPDGAVLFAEHASRGKGFASVTQAVQITHQLEIKLSPTDTPSNQRVTGTLSDEDGEPVIGASVTIAPGIARPASSDDSGDFEVVGAAEGPWRVRISHPDYISVNEQRDTSPMTFTLSRGGSVRGRVRDGDGKAVPAFTVAVMAAEGIGMRTVTSSSVLDAQGEFQISGLSPGEYRLVVVAQGFAQSDPIPATASASNPSVVDVKLAIGGTLVGKVVSEEGGAPLANAKVSAETSVGYGNSALPMVRTAITESDGSFELKGLAPGRGSVNIAAFRHNPRIVGGLEFKNGQTTGPVNIAISPTQEGEQPKLEVAGIGVSIGPAGDGLRVTKVFEGSGAQAAGINEGDVIVRVERNAVVDVGFDAALQQIRGPVDTVVRLTIKRPGGDVQDLSVMRKKITVPG